MILPNLERTGTRFQVIHPHIESYLFHKVTIRGGVGSNLIYLKLHIYVPVDKPFKSLLELPVMADEIEIRWLDATGSYIDSVQFTKCRIMTLDTSDSMDINNDTPLSVTLDYYAEYIK